MEIYKTLISFDSLTNGNIYKHHLFSVFSK